MNLLNETPLLLALKRGHWAVATRLIERGANINFGDAEGHSPLWCAVACHGSNGSPNAGAVPVVRAMLLKGADQTMWCKKHPPVLEIAMSRGDTAMAALLRPFLARDRDANARTEVRIVMSSLDWPSVVVLLPLPHWCVLLSQR